MDFFNRLFNKKKKKSVQCSDDDVLAVLGELFPAGEPFTNKTSKGIDSILSGKSTNCKITDKQLNYVRLIQAIYIISQKQQDEFTQLVDEKIEEKNRIEEEKKELEKAYKDLEKKDIKDDPRFQEEVLKIKREFEKRINELESEITELNKQIIQLEQNCKECKTILKEEEEIPEEEIPEAPSRPPSLPPTPPPPPPEYIPKNLKPVKPKTKSPSRQPKGADLIEDIKKGVQLKKVEAKKKSPSARVKMLAEIARPGGVKLKKVEKPVTKKKAPTIPTWAQQIQGRRKALEESPDEPQQEENEDWQ